MRTRREAIAQHEATHAVVALKLGLPVEWVSIDHGLDEGIHYVAAVKLPDEKLDMERDRFALCVAMAAPSFFLTSDEEVDHYAELEASLSYTLAGKNGIPPADVYDDAATLVSDNHVEILDLAERLETEGRVVFATA
jgi:exoribonuclease II